MVTIEVTSIDLIDYCVFSAALHGTSMLIQSAAEAESVTGGWGSKQGSVNEIVYSTGVSLAAIEGVAVAESAADESKRGSVNEIVYSTGVPQAAIGLVMSFINLSMRASFSRRLAFVASVKSYRSLACT